MKLTRLATFTTLTLTLALAACSKKTPPPEPTQAPPAADAAAPAPEDAAAPAPEDAAAPAPEDAAAPAPEDAAPAQADAAPAGPAALWSVDGFSTPESVLVTPEGDAYLVSNINGSPFDKDDNGFISKLGPDGKLVELKWIDGAKDDVALDAPKGMAIQGGVLFVADIDQVRKFDAKTGAPLGSIAVEGATFLNDVAALPDGTTVYVSDSALGQDFKPSGTAAIFAITGDAAPAALEIGEALGNPNGVAVEAGPDGELVHFVGFDMSKAIKRFDPKTKATTSVALPAGQLDGLVLVKDGEATWIIVSSWETGSVYKVDATGTASVVASGLKGGPADIAVDAAKKVVLVPVFMESRVAAYAL